MRFNEGLVMGSTYTWAFLKVRMYVGVDTHAHTDGRLPFILAVAHFHFSVHAFQGLTIVPNP